MGRIEENQELIASVSRETKKVAKIDSMGLLERYSYSCGNIVVLLADISMSLAIIADHYEEMAAEKEAQENEALGMAILEHERKRREDDGK